ncbi:Glucosamine-6-phosphate isomerase (Glucosamine-6-phosphate deaminase) (GNPDA) (GlcN6P deaminase) [Coemansia sp. RSA 2702]|nr:Glucosamine-6-phosphate isomerase (Glucosamine-6-phosphate deaminase) (GNPDA) (GlcN6P deaminase) [Coemansia sp. RSA 2702]
MRLIIREDPKAVAYYTANYVRQRINEFRPTRERPFVLGLPTGSTPVEVYWHLVDFYKRGLVSFRNVVTFSMDEYVGLPREHPESYCSFMRRHLYDHINLRPESINMLDGNAEDLAAECQRYEAKIKEVGGIELFLGGIGPDGHIAFNEPGSSLESVTRVKTLAYETVLANARFFGGDVNKVPKLALTVGVGTVRAAREVLLIITGAHKAVALAKCIEEGVNHMWTLSVVQLHPAAMIVCDEDATLELHVKTVRYFKSIEQVQEQLIGRQNIGLKGSISKLPHGDAAHLQSPALNPSTSAVSADSSDEDIGSDDDAASSNISADSTGEAREPELDSACAPAAAPEDAAAEHYPRFMLPRASGMSTMGEIHALVPSPLVQSPAGSAASLARDDQAAAYPPTWHEYEDQFNYFYSCHFIEQDYYDYLANNMRRTSNGYLEAANSGSDEEMVEYSDDDGASIASERQPNAANTSPLDSAEARSSQ